MDANYNFIFVDIGHPGSTNDAKIWQESILKKALDKGALNLPPPEDQVPFHFLGDDIFPLMPTLMKPYSRGDHISAKERIFNYKYWDKK